MGSTKWEVSTEEAIEAVAALQEAAESSGDQLRILDVGGAMKPLVFATHVIDMLSYSNRAWYGHIPDAAGRGAERFSEETWLVHDLCEVPWPYEDNEFDVVWCTQTIEDIRDPIAVLGELSRIGKCGYINTIHRNFESQLDVNSPIFTGYVHHRWLIEPDGKRFRFMFKYPLLLSSEYRPAPTGIKELGCWWTSDIAGYEVHLTSLQEIQDEFTNYAAGIQRTQGVWDL